MSAWSTGIDLVLGMTPVTGVEAVTPAAWARLLGRLHPAAVHLPIGLILGAGILEALGIVRRREVRSTAALPCVLLAVPAAAMAAWFGWVGAEAEPPGRALAQTLLYHRWIGVAAAIAVAAAALVALLDLARTHRWFVNTYRGALALAVLLVAAGGYLGAEMVYGENHLLEVFRDPTPPPPDAVRVVAGPGADALDTSALPDTPVEAVAAGSTAIGVLFARDVQPILAERCVSCHGPRRRKAGLRLDSIEAIYGDDREFWTVEPGRPEESLLYQRIVLPADHPDRMPGRGEPLTPEQIDVIRQWIAGGGSRPARVAADTAATPVDAPTTPTETRGPASTPSDEERERAADDDASAHRALDALRARGAVALPTATDGSLVAVNLSLVEPPATDDDLVLLDGLQSTLARLDLARAAVTDAGLARLEGFAALRRLRLDNTGTGDAGLTHLAGLGRLEYLNLYGTGVTDAGLATIAEMRGLRKVYLWETGVTEAGVATLRETRPDLDIVVGATLALVAASEEPAEVAILPACCAAARAAGGECEHPCCVEAAKAGKVCEQCAGG